jgi:hypothetical protein
MSHAGQKSYGIPFRQTYITLENIVESASPAGDFEGAKGPPEGKDTTYQFSMFPGPQKRLCHIFVSVSCRFPILCQRPFSHMFIANQPDFAYYRIGRMVEFY